MPDSFAIVGFSQGAMLALHMASLGSGGCGVVSLSGMLAWPEAVHEQAAFSRPPVLFIHGEKDPIVPIACMRLAAQTMNAAGFATGMLERGGLEHNIDAVGIRETVNFLRAQLRAFPDGENPDADSSSARSRAASAGMGLGAAAQGNARTPTSARRQDAPNSGVGDPQAKAQSARRSDN